MNRRTLYDLGEFSGPSNLRTLVAELTDVVTIQEERPYEQGRDDLIQFGSLADLDRFIADLSTVANDWRAIQ